MATTLSDKNKEYILNVANNPKASTAAKNIAAKYAASAGTTIDAVASANKPVVTAPVTTPVSSGSNTTSSGTKTPIQEAISAKVQANTNSVGTGTTGSTVTNTGTSKPVITTPVTEPVVKSAGVGDVPTVATMKNMYGTDAPAITPYEKETGLAQPVPVATTQSTVGGDWNTGVVTNPLSQEYQQKTTAVDPTVAALIAKLSETKQDPDAIAIRGLLEQQLANQKAQIDYAKGYGDYMAKFKPEQTQEEYIANANALAGSNANLKYDATADSLKSRVASVIADLTRQKGGLEGKYKPQYQQTEQSKYDTAKALANNIARSGMANSGVASGTNMQNELNFNKQLQAIDLQKQAELAAIQGKVTDQTTSMNDELGSLERQKADYLAQQKQQSGKDYIDLLAREKQFASDNYWKGAGLNQSADATKAQQGLGLLGQLQGNKIAEGNLANDTKRVDLTAQDMTKKYDLAYDQLAQTDNQFTTELKEKIRQFDTQAQNDMTKYYADNNLDWEKMKQASYQFEQTKEMNIDQFNREMTMKSAQMANDYSIATIRAQVDREKMANDVQQFKDELSAKYGSESPAYKQMINDENGRIFGAMGNMMEKVKTGTIKPGEAINYTIGLVRASPLDGAYKKAAIDAANNLWKEVVVPQSEVATATKNTSASSGNMANGSAGVLGVGIAGAGSLIKNYGLDSFSTGIFK